MISNAKLTESAKVINAFGPAAPSTSSSQYISLKDYNRCSIVINFLNGSTVTGSAIGLTQATAVAGTGAKTLAFTTVDANVDCAAGDALTATAVASNTFTTNTTNSKALLYVIEVKASDLDVANSFDCLKVTLATAANTTGQVTYILRDPRFADAAPPSAIVD